MIGFIKGLGLMILLCGLMFTGYYLGIKDSFSVECYNHKGTPIIANNVTMCLPKLDYFGDKLDSCLNTITNDFNFKGGFNVN